MHTSTGKRIQLVIVAILLLVLAVLVAFIGYKLFTQTTPDLADSIVEIAARPAAKPPAAQPANEPAPLQEVSTREQAAALPVVPWPAQQAPAPEKKHGEADYSFYYFTDTQHYSNKYPDTFYTMTAWMRDNIATYNVQYAFVTGDLVHKNNSSNWKVAQTAMKPLEDALPCFVIAGNHDVGTKTQDYSDFVKKFGKRHYKSNPNVRAWYENGRGRVDAIEIQGTKYLFAGLGYGDEEAGVPWLNKQIAKYPDHHVILFFHDYMNSEGMLSNTGEMLFEKVVKKNPNVFLVLCGHRYNTTLLTLDVDDDGDGAADRSVYNVMMNYQGFDNGGDGFLTLIRVYKDDRLIKFDTYSPLLDQWYRLDAAERKGREELALQVNIFD